MLTIDQTQQLSQMHLAPYMQLATLLIGKSREGGGNMFRHQLDTMSILVDYGYVDSILLKASIVHDIIEDIQDFNHNNLLSIDVESHAVYDLVMEVTRQRGEAKSDFLTRIREIGSHKAKILKVADRISNMISLGFVNNLDFVERYINETENYILPIASQVSNYMVIELKDLISSRIKYLEGYRSYISNNEIIDPQEFI